MVRRKEAKIASLVLTVAVLLLQCLDVPLENVGLSGDSPVYARFLYPFFHANMLHAAINCWCLLSVVFIYDVSLAAMAVSYLVAVLYPIGFFSPDALPTVGLSGVCYTLMGRVAFCVRERWKYQLYMLSYIAVGFLLPGFNGCLHLYCYIAGLLVGFLNKPIRR